MRLTPKRKPSDSPSNTLCCDHTIFSKNSYADIRHKWNYSVYCRIMITLVEYECPVLLHYNLWTFRFGSLLIPDKCKAASEFKMKCYCSSNTPTSTLSTAWSEVMNIPTDLTRSNKQASFSNPMYTESGVHKAELFSASEISFFPLNPPQQNPLREC